MQLSNILRSPTRIAQSTIRVHVTIPGDPVSKQRPRLALNAGGTVYTPRSTTEAQESIGWEIKVACRSLILDDSSAFGVRLHFYSKTRQRRDIDNLTKLFFDACTGIVWADDSQVEEMSARIERASAEPRTEAVIYTLRSTTPYIECAACGKRKRTFPSWQANSKSGRRFCSQECYYTSVRAGLMRDCDTCGQAISVTGIRAKAKGKVYCSDECRYGPTRITLPCEQCGVMVTKPRCFAHQHTYCSIDCRDTLFRGIRAASARGTCADCGGTTTKKSYTRCKACQVAARKHSQLMSKIVRS